MHDWLWCLRSWMAWWRVWNSKKNWFKTQIALDPEHLGSITSIKGQARSKLTTGSIDEQSVTGTRYPTKWNQHKLLRRLSTPYPQGITEQPRGTPPSALYPSWVLCCISSDSDSDSVPKMRGVLQKGDTMSGPKMPKFTKIHQNSQKFQILRWPPKFACKISSKVHFPHIRRSPNFSHAAGEISSYMKWVLDWQGLLVQHSYVTPEWPQSAQHTYFTPEWPQSAHHRYFTPEWPQSAHCRFFTPEWPHSICSWTS